MDYFDPFSRPDLLARVVADPVRYLLLSFDTDWRFSTAHTLRILAHVERAGLPVTFRELEFPLWARLIPAGGSGLPCDVAGVRGPRWGGALMSKHSELRLDLALVADQIFEGSRGCWIWGAAKAHCWNTSW